MISLLKDLSFDTFYVQVYLGLVYFKDLMNCYVRIVLSPLTFFDNSLYTARA